MIFPKYAFIWLMALISIIYPIQALPLQTISTDAGKKLHLFGNFKHRSEQNVPLKANVTLKANSTKKFNGLVTKGYKPFLLNSTEQKLYENFKDRKVKTQRKINGSTNIKKNTTHSARTTVSVFLNMFASKKFRFGPKFGEISKITGRGPPPDNAPQKGGGSSLPGGALTEVATNGPGGEEITISIPRFHRNEKGIWVYNKWQATYGKVWHGDNYTTVPRIEIDSNPVINYYPPNEVNSVCMDASTLYNVPPVRSWLSETFYSHKNFKKKKIIWNELRREIYDKGNSEQCHEYLVYAKGLEFMECALRRNQRMEYLIPKYPLHQIVAKERTRRPFKPTTKRK